jgi:pSer/pThr/pTyr-binding forkhead associated (FHA) protein
MEAKLIVRGGNHDGQVIPVKGPKFFIGRADDCALRPRSDLVSRHHCAIIVEDAYVAVRDFGSKNGTFVNGEQVHGEQEIKSGDRLEVGQLAFELKVEVPVGGQKKPKIHSVREAAARTVEAAVNEDDLDVSSWLSEEEEDTADTGTIDLDELKASSTETAQIDAASETTQEQPAKDAEDEEEEQKIVGTWEKSKKKLTAASSRDAAADVLKNFFRRF